MNRRPDYGDEERVLGTQARSLGALREERLASGGVLDDAVARAEALAEHLSVRRPLPAASEPEALPCSLPLPPFADMAAAAAEGAGLRDALTESEMEEALGKLHGVGRLPSAETALDRWDWVAAGSAGLLAGLADIVLVQLPRNPLVSFGEEGGPLPNGVRALLERMLPPRTVSALEARYPVPFDTATNRGLLKPVPGLYPASHRFHSLGHDPLLGWLLGVRDVLDGTLTAVGRDGVLLTQQVANPSVGQDAFGAILEAFRRVGGHMLSDVSTPMGLPAPLMPLLEFLQCGTIGPEGHTVAETARQMYLEGYDFRHFVAGGLTSCIVEVIVRGAWVVRRRREGKSLRDSLPDSGTPRLRHQLLVGHLVAAAVNGGKVAVMSSPLALNWAQWLTLLRYLGPEIASVLASPVARAAAEDRMLDGELAALARAEGLWSGDLPFWPEEGIASWGGQAGP